MRNLLKFYRWEKGLKQYEMAARLGCSAPYLSMVENAREEPTEAFKERAARILKIPVEVLFPSDGVDPRRVLFPYTKV